MAARWARPVLHVLSLRGRASRREYAVLMVLTLLWALPEFAIEQAWPTRPVVLVVGVLDLLTFYLFVAVSVRRLHDFGKSGWLLTLYVLPIVGWVLIGWSLLRPSRGAALGDHRQSSPRPGGLLRPS